jgi:DNA polymerase III delta prime subunit
MHAFIYTGSTVEARNEMINKQILAWHIHAADQIIVSPDPTSITIGIIREFIGRLSLSPQYSPSVAGIIHDAHTLTHEAQQALLKTLEEPPPRAFIVLEAASTAEFLPTILSRCIVKAVRTETAHFNENQIVCRDLFQQLQSASVGNRLKSIDSSIHTREEAKQFVTDVLQVLSRELIANFGIGKQLLNQHIPTPLLCIIIRKMHRAMEYLNSNINPKLAIDTIFL